MGRGEGVANPARPTPSLPRRLPAPGRMLRPGGGASGERARSLRRPGRTWREPTAPARTRQVSSRRRPLASPGVPLVAGPASFVSTAATRSRVPAAIAAAFVRRAPGHAGLPEEQAAPAGLSPPQGFRRASPPSRGPAAGPCMCASAVAALGGSAPAHSGAPRFSRGGARGWGRGRARPGWAGAALSVAGDLCPRLCGVLVISPTPPPPLRPYVGNRFGA